MGCHFLLQGIFPTQVSNSSLLQLLHYRRILYPEPPGKSLWWKTYFLCQWVYFCFVCKFICIICNFRSSYKEHHDVCLPLSGLCHWVGWSLGPSMLLQKALLHSCCFFKFLFIFKNYFNWRLITLQYCDGFCHTSTWISHGHTYIPPSWNSPSHLPPPSSPLDCPRLWFGNILGIYIWHLPFVFKIFKLCWQQSKLNQVILKSSRNNVYLCLPLNPYRSLD